jgi:hypothetical protein
MHKDAGPLYVFQELVAKANSFVGAFKKTGNVGRDKILEFIDFYDAQVRFFCSEGICGYFWVRRRYP